MSLTKKHSIFTGIPCLYRPNIITSLSTLHQLTPKSKYVVYIGYGRAITIPVSHVAQLHTNDGNRAFNGSPNHLIRSHAINK